MRMTPVRRLFLIGAALFVMRSSCTAADARCGNGVLEPGEDCDGGGTCVGGMNAGIHCVSESQCQGNGVCVGGAKAESGCADNSACPDAQCIHCRTFGGDGCAANCTIEREVTMSFVPGMLTGIDITPGTSGQVIHGDILTIPLPLDGQQTLWVGKQRNGVVPVAIRADSFIVARIPIGLPCGCLRAVVYKTCGGTLYETDGVTPSPNCTEGYGGGGAGVCVEKNPCTAAFGAGNSALGIIGCNGLAPINFTVVQDSGGSSGHAAPAMYSWNDTGGPGSAVMFSATSLGIIVGLCTGSTPDYGPDGEICTADDPLTSRGVAAVAPLVTGKVSGKLQNANGVDGNDVGPFSLNGAPFDCVALANGNPSGATLVGVSISLNQRPFGDIVTTSSFVSQPAPLNTPTPVISTCIGDCNGDGEATVDEIIRMVNILLVGDTSPSTCPGTEQWCNSGTLAITCLVDAVNNALHSCPASTPAPSRLPNDGGDR